MQPGLENEDERRLRQQLAQNAATRDQPAKSNWMADLLPFTAGTGGAAGGAALGAGLGSIVPGVGTAIGGIAGGILGGALGSGGGQAAKNVSIGEEDVMKDVGKEALLGGAFSLPPLRAAKGVASLAKGGGKEGFERAFTGQTAEQMLAGGGRPAAQAGRQKAAPTQAADFPEQDISSLAAGEKGRLLDEAAETQRQNRLSKEFIENLNRKEAASADFLAAKSPGSNIGTNDLRAAEDAANYNRLAMENLTRRQGEEMTPLAGNAGALVRPDTLPSASSEGIELATTLPNKGSASDILASIRGTATASPPPRPQPKSFATEGIEPKRVPEVPADSQLAKGVTDAVTPAQPAGSLQRISERLQGAQTGIRPGQKIGSQQLTAKRAKQLQDHVKDIGARPTDAADTILRRNESFLRNQESAIENVLTAKNKPLTGNTAENILKSAKRPAGIGTEEMANHPIYRGLRESLETAPDIKSLHAVRKEADKRINFARNPESPDPMGEEVAQSFRDSISKHLGKEVPELKPINQAYSKGKDVETFIAPKAAKPSADGGLSGGVGAFGLPQVGARAMQGAAGLGGRMTGAIAGDAAPMAREGIGSIPGLAAREGIGRVAASPFIPSESEADPTVSPELQSAEGAGILGGADMMGADMGAQQTGIPSPEVFQREAMNAMKAGDMDTAKEILAMGEAMAPAATEETELQGKMGTARTIVDNLMNTYDQVGGGSGLYSGTATDIMGKLNIGGEDKERARAYEENRKAYLSQVIRAFGEVGVLTDKDREVVASAIPSIKDTPAQADQKRNLLYTMMETIAASPGTAANAGGAAMDPQAASILQEYGY